MIASVIAADSGFGTTMAIIIGVGMAAQWAAWRTQIPSIILLLGTGLLLGPGLEVIDPDRLLGDALFPVVSISVAIILFEGGLDLPPRELRAAGTVVRRLITIGALVTFAVAFWSAQRLFGIGQGAAAVVAAVLVVTGPTVVGPLLRFVKPAGRTGPMLRAEGILIDPIGATAALIAFEAALANQPGEAITTVIAVIGLTLLAGLGIGFVIAIILDQALRRFLIPDHLVNPVALATVVVAFVLADRVQEESGLLAVTVMGIWLARRDSAAVRQLLEFNESLRTLLISLLFILLAARIETAQLRDVVLPAAGFLAVLVFVARPASVIVSTVRTKLSWRERIFLMAMAPRGIVAAAISAIFALRLEEEGIPGADLIVPIIFLVVIGSIVVYGLLAGPAARRLGLAEHHAEGVLVVGAHPAGRGFASQLRHAGVTTLLVDTDPYNITRAVREGLAARRLSVLTEDATYELDLRGIGRLFAITPNDEVNALATSRFARLFGRRETFQLKPSGDPGAAGLPEGLVGRIVGIEGIDYRTIDRLSREGWRVITAPAGSAIAAATERKAFIPMARLLGGRVAFICHNDPVPEQGSVIGLASPETRARYAPPPERTDD